MSNIDPNTYALSMSLQLDTALADTSIDRIESTIIELEDKIARAVQNSISNVSTGIASIISEISQVTALTSQLNTDTSGLSAQMASAQMPSDNLDNLTSALALTESISDSHQGLIDKIALEDIHVQDVYDSLTSIDKALQTKNIKHKEELDLVEEENETVNNLYDGWKNVTGQVKDAGKEQRDLFNSLSQIYSVLSNFDKETDNFTEANYRLIGSQYEMVEATNLLAASTGLSRRETFQTYKALADVKYPKEQIGALTESITKFGLVTGVSSATSVEYSQAMRQAGFDAEATSISLTRMANAQRFLGLSSLDTQRLMQQQTKDSATQITFFGQESVKQFELIRIGLAALGKETGLAVTEQEELMKMIQSTDDSAVNFFVGLGNLDYSKLSDPEARFNALGDAVQNFANISGMSLEQLANENKTPEQMAMLKGLAGQFGTTAEAVSSLARAQLQLVDAGKEGLLTFDGLNDSLEDQMELDKLLAEAQDTMTKQFEKLYGRFVPIATVVMITLTEVIGEVLLVVNSFIDYLVGLGQAIIDVYKIMEPWLISLDKVYYYFKLIAATAIVLGGALGGLIPVFGLLGRSVALVSRGMMSFATAAGNAIRAFVSAVAPVAKPLLQISAAVLAIGAGALMMAQSFQIMFTVFKEFNAMADGAYLQLAAFLGLILLFTAGLVGLGALAQGPVALGLLAIGATFLMLGAAMYLVGAGFSYLADAALNMAQALVIVVQLFDSMDMVGFGTKLIIGGALIVAGAAYMVIAGGALLAAAVPMGAGIVAFRYATSGLVGLTENMLKAGQQMHLGGLSFKGGIIEYRSAFDLLAELRGLAGEAMSGLSDIFENIPDISAANQFIGFLSAISVVGPNVLSSAQAFQTAMQFLRNGAIALNGLVSDLVRSSTDLLFSTDKLGDASDLLILSSIKLGIGLNSILALTPMMIATNLSLSGFGLSLLAASSVLLLGTIALESAVQRIVDSAKGLVILQTVAQSIDDLIASITKLNGIQQQIANLDAAMVAWSLAFEKMKALPAAVQEIAGQMTQSVTALTGPIDQLNSLLMDSQDVVMQYGSVVADQFAIINGELNNYAISIQNVLDKINTLSAARGVISNSAREAGDTIRAETISNVMVMSETEGRSTDENSLMMKQGIALLGTIVELLDQVAKGKADLTDVAGLISQANNKPKSSMASALNNWI